MKKILFKTITLLLVSSIIIGCNKTENTEQETQANDQIQKELSKEEKAMNAFTNTFVVLSGTMMQAFGGSMTQGDESQAKLEAGIKEMTFKMDSVFSNIESSHPDIYKKMVENPEFLKGADIVPEVDLGVKPLTEDLAYEDIKTYIDKAIESSTAAETEPFNKYIKASSEWAMSVSGELNKDPEFALLMK